MSSIPRGSSAPQPPDDDGGPPRPPSSHRHARYDDFDDDFEAGQPRSGINPSSAGLVGFIFSLVSIGLLLVVAVLWYFLDQEQARDRNVESKRWMLYWFLFLDALSFFASIAAIVMGGKGLTPTNPLYRGFSMAALILGLLEIITTLMFGLFMTCFVFIFEVLGRR